MTHLRSQLTTTSCAGARRLVNRAAARRSGFALFLGVAGLGNAFSSGPDVLLVWDLPASVYEHPATATAIEEFDRSLNAGSRTGVVSARGERVEWIAALGARRSLS